MATVTKWTPYGVALNVTATAGTITRTSATKYTVVLNVSWKCYWSGNKTNYGMSATSGGVTKTISSFGTSRASGSASFTGTFSISGTGKQTKSITVTFKNYNSDTGASASKTVTLSVSVPAWPTYAVKYSGNATGAANVPSSQTKVKGTALKLSTTKPTLTGHTFQGWGTSAADTSVNYAPGASYSTDAAITLYAIWKANTYTVSFDANGGTGEPSSVTKTYGANLALPTTVPTRANYNFLGWSTSAAAMTAEYEAGGTYAKNSAATLYAVWELAYWVPKITNVSVGRCDANGDADDLGAYFKAEFEWECCQLLGTNNVSSIEVAWKTKSETEYANKQTVTPNGTTSGTQSHKLGGSLTIDDTYDVRVTVADASESSVVYMRIPAYAFAFDAMAGGLGAAIGKVAELAGFLDIAFKALVRDTSEVSAFEANTGAFVIGDLNGQHIAFDSNEVQAKAGPTTPGWFYVNKDGGGVWIGNSEAANKMPGMIESTYDNVAYVQTHPTTGVSVKFGVGSGGTNHGIWSDAHGSWLIRGDGENIALWSPNGLYKPYYTAGDSVSVVARLAGFCTSSKTQVHFCVPLGRPIYGISSVTVSSQTDGGLMIRQDGNYTHGSSASEYVKPASYTATYSPHGFVNVVATYGTTTNAVNNAACGVVPMITLKFNA